MGAHAGSHALGHISLHFSDRQRPRLERVEFAHPSLFAPIVSHRLNGKVTLQNQSFKWNQGVRALAVLFLRFAAARDEQSASDGEVFTGLSGGPNSLASHLDRAISAQSSWLANMFGTDADGTPMFKAVFVRSRTAARNAKGVSVFVNKSLVPAKNVSLFIDDERIARPDCAAFAEKIERIGRVSVCDSTARELTPSESRIAGPYPAARTEIMRNQHLFEVSRGLLNVAQSVMQRTGTNSDLRTMQAGSKAGELIVQLSQRVEITILNGGKKSRIKFLYDIANFGMTTFTHRTHPLWFEGPEADLNFDCRDASGAQLKVDIVQSSAHFREIQINFSRPLEPSERFQYEFSYEVHEESIQRQFFYVRARTLTNILSLTVHGINGISFCETSIMHESADGFLSDTPPILRTSTEQLQPKLYWEKLCPNPGDLFRTFWGYDRTAKAGQQKRPGSPVQSSFAELPGKKF